MTHVNQSIDFPFAAAKSQAFERVLHHSIDAVHAQAFSRTIDQIFGGRSCSSSILICRKNIARRGSPRDGGSAETLSAKRGTVRFARTAGVFSVTYEPWSSSIFKIAHRV